MKVCAREPLGQAGKSYERARLRWATVDDGERLQRLFERAGSGEPESRESMREWLEQGGALLLEDGLDTLLCAVRWRENGDGWRVDRVVTLPEARGLGFGRWLMTKVEALAIKYNIPSLSVLLADEELLGYYNRLGYARDSENSSDLLLSKRVGGTWQMQERAKT